MRRQTLSERLDHGRRRVLGADTGAHQSDPIVYDKPVRVAVLSLEVDEHVIDDGEVSRGTSQCVRRLIGQPAT
jgi:hypothetical protein